MKRLTPVLLSMVLLLPLCPASAAEQALTAEDIVNKNIAARGGLDAWQAIHTMMWIGHIENRLAGSSSLPFMLQMKRPNLTRFEISAQNHVSMRLFDGKQGWKVRDVNGQPDVQSFTQQEVNYARSGPGLDGLLMSYQRQGGAIALDGMDTIDGRRAYRLGVTLPSGMQRYVWIDAQTFLECKDVRPSRNAAGKEDTISVFYRDYDTFDGLRIARTLETRVNNAPATEKLVIDKIVLNPPLDDRTFAKPRVAGQRTRGIATMPGMPPIMGGAGVVH